MQNVWSALPAPVRHRNLVKPLAVVALIAMLLVTLVQTAAPAAGIAGAGIHAWSIEQESPTHTYTQAQAIDDAQRFDVITALRGSYRGHVAAMKQANPNLTLSVYMNGAFAQANQETAFPDAWYLRDASGNKVKNNWGIWLMDPSNAGWVANRVQECQNALAYSGYDGCFIDNLGPGAIWGPSLTGDPINPSTGAVWTRQEWMAATSVIAAQIRTQISPRPVIVNGLGAGFEYFNSSAPTSQLLDAVDYGVAEMWIRPASQAVGSFRDEASWKQDVDLLVDASAKGKHVLTSTKVWVDATQAQKDQLHEYALASFLLADDGRHVFTFSYGRTADPSAGHDWWNVDLGAPSAAYGKRDGVYQRDFTAGRVLVNPTGSAVTVNLGGTYTDLSGASVTTVTMAPHTGRILRTVGGAGTGGGSTSATAPSTSSTTTFGGTVTAGGADWKVHSVDVAAGSTITATLSWGADANLNLGLRDPSGTWVAWSSTTANPEVINAQATAAGTWTLGVKAVSGSSTYTLDVDVADAAPVNQAPSVTVTSPADGGSLLTSDTVSLTGSASDVEDGDLSSALSWTSDLDGPLGTGASVAATLSAGTHRIAASVVDSAGARAESAVTVTVTAPTPTGDFTGTVTAGGADWQIHRIDVTQPGTIDATLSWTAADADLNLGLQDPSGAWVAWASSTTARPETLSFTASVAGTWTLGVKARIGSATYGLSASVTGSSTSTASGSSTASSAGTVEVSSVDTTLGGNARSPQLTGTIAVADGTGAAVGGATVTLQLQRNGTAMDQVTVTTGADGTASAKWRKLAAGCYVIVVVGVTAGALTWDGATPSNGACL